ncbi:hypothetical protein [Streptomyces sp. NPDC029526]|uniref:hypothetical protein n=1 Tax=Streptomyces sp. NPDC029526 TaxID=3155728 RepID=UPI0033C32B99
MSVGYHAHPAHAAFGGYKGSGTGHETRKMRLDHYQQTKNQLVNNAMQRLGLFRGAPARVRRTDIGRRDLGQGGRSARAR